MKKQTLIPAVIAAVAVAGIVAVLLIDGEQESFVKVPVEKGNFVIKVTTTGELRAQKSQKIYAPSGLANRRLGIGNVQITDIVPEGTKVDSGDYVATLDRNKVLENLRSFEEELQKTRSQFIQTKLDTAMNLKQARNGLIDNRYALEEAKIRKKQSQYESPATQRKAQIALEKAQRALKQAKENYQLKKEQAKAKMTNIQVTLNQQKRRIAELKQLLDNFRVEAPDSGMVIYHTEWNGEKREVGSKISSWDMVVATLPDLSSMISETYVNETDISKVSLNQKVHVSVDAFPEQSYQGKVAKIANVGEELEGTNTKVFKVRVKLTETDSLLRPAMTTKNEIITGKFSQVLHVPLETLHRNEEFAYIFVEENSNIVKQEINPGDRNENRIIIKAGLEEDDQVLLSVPENKEEAKIRRLSGNTAKEKR